jgi:mRNA-degrading endonuclease HigB of HigAB toxin-antitoxin module
MRYIFSMRVISYKKIQDFTRKHATGRKPLEAWYKKVKHTNFGSFSDLRKTFPTPIR